jgi:hypothetical protein
LPSETSGPTFTFEGVATTFGPVLAYAGGLALAGRYSTLRRDIA